MINWLKNFFKKQDNLNIRLNILNINRPTHDEIKQIIIDETNKSINKKDTWSIISNITQLLGLAIPVSILIGSILVYFYLDKLGAISLFAEIISTPSSIISIIIMFTIIIVMVFFIPFYMPYVFILNFKDKGNIQITKQLWWLSLLPTLLLILNISLKICYKTNYLLYNYDLYVNIFLLLILPFITIFFAIKRYSDNKIKTCKQTQSTYDKVGTIFRFLELFINYLVLNLCPILFIYFFILLSTSWLTWDDNIFSISSIYSIIISILMLFSYIMNLYLILSIKNDKQVNSNDLLFPIIVILSIGCVIIAASHSKVSTNLFLNLGYIEKNTDARWYLLDTRFINQNGLVKKEGTTGLNDIETLSKWKNKFSVMIPVPKANNIVYFDLMTQEHIYRQQQKNTMYGYMAWNLGKTKIFCPYDITIKKAEENKITLDKICLTINGDYLQPIPDGL